MDIPKTLVGVPPSPGLAALRPVEHAFGVAFVAPVGRSFPHIRAGSIGASRAGQGCAGEGTVYPQEISRVMGSITIISSPIFRAWFTVAPVPLRRTPL